MKKNVKNNAGITGVRGGSRESWCNCCGRKIILVEVAKVGEVAIHKELTEEELRLQGKRGCTGNKAAGGYGDAEGGAAIWDEREPI